MFDANAIYLPKGIKFIVFVESISKQSPLYLAGARKDHRYEALKTSEPSDDESSVNTMTVVIDGKKVDIHDGIDTWSERLVFDGVMPTAAEMFTKENYPLNKKGL
tara:strand:- start:3047 stop:3361 length:315 start_codon:yes stop_codon:yes gene_type:complete